MRLLPASPEIGPNTGFDPKIDIFERKVFGIGLGNLLSNVEDPLVLVLDSQWGSGKTTFTKMWAGYLREQRFPVIYFDAFANDFMSDAFTAIAGEVLSIANETLGKDKASYQKYLENAIGAGKVLLRSDIKIGAKAATLGALSDKDLGELQAITEDVANEAADITDAYLKEHLEKHTEQKLSIENFRTSLSSLAKGMGAQIDPQEEGSKKASKPLIFIIDELDRCKPTFALSLLESIKHFFAVQGVHFVLVTHLKQLENCVRYSYGPEIDASTYLQKFYNISVSFPYIDENRSDVKKYLSHLEKNIPATGNSAQLKSALIHKIGIIAERNALSLRTVERVISCVSLMLAYTGERNLRLQPLIAGLCVLKVCKPELYEKAAKGRLRYKDIQLFLGLEELAKYDGKNKVPIQERDAHWWVYCLEPDFENYNVDWTDYTRPLYQYSVERERLVPFTASSIIDRFTFGQ